MMNQTTDHLTGDPIHSGPLTLHTARQATETRQLVLTGRCGSREFACQVDPRALCDLAAFKAALLRETGMWAVGFRLSAAGQICHDAADWDLAIGNAIRRGAEPADAPQNAQND